MDEQEFTEYLRKSFTFSYGRGVGDDCSVVKQNDHHQLITKDLLVEGTHFDWSYFSPEELGRKAIAVNISDVQAMGGIAQYFYLGLGLPGDFPKENIFKLFDGIRESCNQWDIELAGGDYSVCAKCFISVTMIGQAEKVIYRDGAQDGDLIGISGPTGESAVGLKLLKQGIHHPFFEQKHKEVKLNPGSGSILSRYVNSMIDVSDGLLIDLQRIVDASKKGADISYETIPVSDELRKACRCYKIDEYEVVLGGGEDYVLLFTVSEKEEKNLRKENLQYSIIGRVSKPLGKIRVLHNSKEVPVKRFGYDHFKNSVTS